METKLPYLATGVYAGSLQWQLILGIFCDGSTLGTLARTQFTSFEVKIVTADQYAKNVAFFSGRSFSLGHLPVRSAAASSTTSPP